MSAEGDQPAALKERSEMTAKIQRTGSAVDVLRRVRNLHAYAKGTELEVLRELALHADPTGSTFVHASTIARRIGRDVATVYRALRGLRARGMIESVVAPTSTGRANIYRLLLGAAPSARVDVCEMPERVSAECADPPRVAPSSDRDQFNDPPSVPPHELELAAAVEREVCEGGEDQEQAPRPVAGGNSGGNARGPVRRSEDDRIRGNSWTRAECMLALKCWFTRVYPMLDAHECDYACDANVAELRRFIRFGLTPADWGDAVDGLVASPFRIRSVRILVDHRHELIKLGRVAARVEQHRRRELAPKKPAEPPMDVNASRAAAAALLQELERAA
jgi:DNA-binding MarR family transcriptional regulator